MAPVVLHLISSLRVGGAERMLVSLLSAARRDREARYVVCIMNDEIDPGLMAELEACGFPCYRLGRPEGRLHPRYMLELVRIVGRHGVQVVHTHNEGSRKWAMLLRLARPRLKVVYTLHCLGMAERYGAMARQLYRAGVDATVAISPATAREGDAIGARRLVEIPNGVELERFRGARRERFATGPLRLLQVGRFSPEKGQDILIRALANLKSRGVEAACTLAGVTLGARDPWLAELQALARELGVADRVDFVFGRTDVENLLLDADVCVMPSRSEGFGLALVEAMAAGVPVVASQVGGLAALVQDGVNGLLFAAEDAPGLADAIARLAADPTLRRSLAMEGAASAECYGIDATLRDHARLYADLAA
ncbi:glycosyl transferase family 1 [Alsobacter metallidurans]|uniref:Glycosyl transferase family 1 n=1 Tax=Alsobacter metallidurans TaxID=340221 RepID=A0A917I3S0_9HYPH|nr:glycosyltransferase family 4 protein [Alsobacter metallidurans]GGH09479.1 glycosyl transferase family 1 [Alsobacter metallidurans]